MIINDEVQQSKRFEFIVPQTQFFLGVPDSPVATQRQVPTVLTVQQTHTVQVCCAPVVVRRQVPERWSGLSRKLWRSAGAVLEGVVHEVVVVPVVVQRQLVEETAQKTVVYPQLQSIDKVFVIPVMPVRVVFPSLSAGLPAGTLVLSF